MLPRSIFYLRTTENILVYIKLCSAYDAYINMGEKQDNNLNLSEGL